ncbi:MAG: NAD(+) synthase [Eggerthellaceae bacterium]|nr:NAD(+) synthase [Eggerthellaceae bacterium]
MGDLSKLKIAVGQPELVSGKPSVNEQARERMVERAVDAGADLLVMPGSLENPHDVHLVVLNDSRIDVAGNAVYLDACGESYRIGLEPDDMSCDFAVYCDVTPWTIEADEEDQVEMGFVPAICLRPVGMRNVAKNVLAFDGGTKVYGADGLPICVLRDDFEEDLALVRFAGGNRMQEPCENKLLAALVKTMRRFDAQVLPWSPKWIIGLSGGLDSSIVAALLTLAFGVDRVIGYNMATRYNSATTKANASALAGTLGIALRNGSIEPLVDATGEELAQYGYGEDAMTGLVLENVQARVRGHLLSTFAAVEGGVVVNNGNRVEAALGYATLYGDAIGALAPIGDLTKTALFDLARAINGEFGSAVIPENLLPQITDGGFEWDTPPSAELAEGQRDPMKWFYHDWLIATLLDAENVDAAACDVLERYLEDRLEGTEAGRWVGFYGLYDPRAFADDLEWVLRGMRTAAFKRIQAPPAIRVASKASINAPAEVQGEIEPSQRFKNLIERVRSLQ